MRVVVDHRERVIIEYLQTFIPDDITCQVSNLDYGDIHIEIAIDTSAEADADIETHDVTQQPTHIVPTRIIPTRIVPTRIVPTRIVFERKTIADLAASIKDGRYREQKLRLIANSNKVNIAYIVEGDHSFSFDASERCVHGISCKALSGVFINTMFRDDIHIVHTQDAKETAHFIVGLASRIQKNPCSYTTVKRMTEESSTSHQQYTHASIQARRTKRVGHENVFATQLAIIPGVSPGMGVTLASRYGNMAKFVSTLAQMTSFEERSRNLQTIPHLGKKTAACILASLGMEASSQA